MMAAIAGLVLPVLGLQAPAEGLRWQAAAGCPDVVAVTGTIERRLGRALRAGEASVDATVVRVGREFRLSLRLAVAGRGEAREVVDESCAALAEVVALRVAAAVEAPLVPAPPEVAGARPADARPGGARPADARRGEAGPADARRGEAGPADAARVAVRPGEVEPADAARAEVEPADGRPEAARTDGRPEAARTEVRAGAAAPVPSRRSLRPGGVIRVQGGGEYGAVPGVTGAVGLAGGLLWRRVRVELQGVYLAPRTVTREGVTLRVSLLAASLHGCVRWGRGVLEAPSCGGLEVGAMRGVASGPATRTASEVFVAAEIGQGLVWHAGSRVSVWLALQLVLARRPRFEVSNATESREVFTGSLASGRLLAGVELRFGDPW